MTRTVDVRYLVPVHATVDLDEGTVPSVYEYDEDIVIVEPYARALDDLRSLVSEAGEYAGPEDDMNVEVWRTIEAAERAIKLLDRLIGETLQEDANSDIEDIADLPLEDLQRAFEIAEKSDDGWPAWERG
jgi:hypothetical protein